MTFLRLLTVALIAAVSFASGWLTRAAAESPAHHPVPPVAGWWAGPTPPPRPVSRSEVRKPLAKTTRSARTTLPGWPWDALAQCESSGHWNYGAPGAYTDGDGYEGGLNFAPSTWTSFKPRSYPAHAYDATPAQQITVARHVLAVQGWQAWPSCSLKLGLR